MIRPYQESDAARCCEIILACLPQLDGLNLEARDFLIGKLVPERLNAELISIETFVCEEQGKVIGLAALEGDEAKRLYVDPHHQHRGTGRTLFAFIESRARAHGLAQLRGEASPAAAPFYQRLGFVVVGDSEFQRGAAHFRMVKIQKQLDPIDA